MSVFSGKCDLYDHIGGLGGWYDRDGNPVEFGSGVGAYYSDEYRDFLEFKKRTGGVMYQHKVLTVTPWNHDDAKRLCPELEIIEHKKVVSDKRKKSGQREDTYYTYKYWGKEYNLKELNQRKIYITVPIYFETLLDIIPYYPYLVGAACSNNGRETIFIRDESFVDEEFNSHLKHGWCSDSSWRWYKNKLQDHYRKIVLEYFNPVGREYIEEVSFNELYQGHVSRPIDPNFKVEFRWEDGTIHTHWGSPKIIDAASGLIEIPKEDYENDKFFGKKGLIYYVEYKEHSIKLG